MVLNLFNNSSDLRYRPHMSVNHLREQNVKFRGSGGISSEAQSEGFSPAFLDNSTGKTYLSRFSDGRPASIHLLDGLPDQLVVSRADDGRIAVVNHTITAGFLRNEQFYTRQEASQAAQVVTV